MVFAIDDARHLVEVNTTVEQDIYMSRCDIAIIRVGTALDGVCLRMLTQHINIMSYVNRTIGTLGITCTGVIFGCTDD